MWRLFLRSAVASHKSTIAIVALLLAAATFRLFVGINLPIWIRPTLIHDDGLFMRLATNLASGHWLGPYDQFTLMKGPGYPAFLALASHSGLSVSAAHGLFQIAAVAVAAWAIYLLTASRLIAVLTFLVLLFDPVAHMPDVQRVIRDQIYWAQTLMAFSLLTIILYAPPPRAAPTMALSGLAGLIFGWTWLTREEGLWLLPGLALLVTGAFLIHRKDAQALRALARNAGLAAGGWFAVIAAFMTINLLAYGSFVGVDFKERNFQAALNALEDVEVGSVIPYVPVPLAARNEVAKVSPTFKPIADMLAPGGPLAGWSAYGCKFYKQSCGDIAGGWFMWAFRDAAAADGFYKSPKAAAQGYAKIAREIAAACSDGRLKCRHPWLSSIPPMTSAQWASLPGTLEAVGAITAFLNPPNANFTPMSPASDQPEAFERFWAFLNRPFASAPMLKTTVRGWYRDGASTQWPGFAVYDRSGEHIPFTLKRRQSRDLQRHFADQRPAWNRFEISYLCPGKCSLAALAFNRPELRVPIDRDRNISAASGSATLYVDSASYDWQAAAPLNPAQTLAADVRSALAQAYQVLVPVLLFAGLVALMAASDGALAARTLNPVLLVAAAAWVLVATRIVILALIDVSSFPAAIFEYSPSGAYMAVMAAFLSIAAVVVQAAMLGIGGRRNMQQATMP